MRIGGIEIGGTKLQVVLGDENGTIHQRFLHTIEAKAGAGVIRQLIEHDLRQFGDLDAVGVGFGGPVNRDTGTVWTSYHVNGWTGFNIHNWLTGFTGATVSVDNDANVAALGESVVGAGRDHHVVFYVTLGSGVGGGVTIDRKIYHGMLPGELEFGHVRLTPAGVTVQESCSGWAVNDKVLRAIDADKECKLAKFAVHYPGAEAKAIVPAIEAGDGEALEIFDRTMTDLAFGLSHVIHLFHPNTIIIGGGLSLIGEMLRSKVEEKIQHYIMDAFRPGPSVQLSHLGSDVVPVGALILAASNTQSKK